MKHVLTNYPRLLNSLGEIPTVHNPGNEGQQQRQKNPSMMTAEQLVDSLISEIGSPFRIRIGGFPACGKTTLSNLFKDRIPYIRHIEAEAWILPLEQRKTLDLSGAHPDGYERDRSIREIAFFLRGGPLALTTYDHKIGDHVPGSVLTAEPDVPVVLDGTLFSLQDYDGIVPACIFLKPRRLGEWLQASIRRDVDTRFFSEAEATRHNMRKARDLQKVLDQSPQARVVTCNISADHYSYEFDHART
jgi:uridine kinase